jgi:hypothetical protein
MPDLTLSCTDCGSPFTFSESEQEFYTSKGFAPPTHCPDCRARRKAEKAASVRSGQSDGGH